MNVLALEPYYGGSHRALIDGWIEVSRHDWTCLTLPAHHWKWRMRHAAITFADMLKDDNRAFDVIFCSDMLNLATFRGLAPPRISNLPAVVYFHENQLTYPDQYRTQRDYHYAFDNFQTMLAADAVWFNSAYHYHEFFTACRQFLERFPDYSLADKLDDVAKHVQVLPPGLPELNGATKPSTSQPPHIVWAARWEQDKNPDDFFAAMIQVKRNGVDFRLSVAGETFREVPAIFDQARRELNDRIEHWGFLPSRQDYFALLRSSDLFVSTAIHEFFGIAAAESILAGSLPVLPYRLAYPELVDDRRHLLYDGTVAGLVSHLTSLLQDAKFCEAAANEARTVQIKLQNLRWSNLGPRYDQALESIRRG